MDRLKQEWEETVIPEEARLRARNLAWAKIQNPSEGRKALGWVAAVSTALVMTALVWVWSGHNVEMEQTSAPSPQNISQPAIAADEKAKPPLEAPQAVETELGDRKVAPVQPSVKVQDPVRIVLNFKLPKSGARMIWTMDSNFQLGGNDK